LRNSAHSASKKSSNNLNTTPGYALPSTNCSREKEELRLEIC